MWHLQNIHYICNKKNKMGNSRKIIGRAEAEEVLKPYYRQIVNAMESAFNDYLNVVNKRNAEGQRSEFRKSTIAGMVHDFTRIRIRDQFLNNEGVVVREYKKIFTLKILDKVLIRFKKLNADYSTSNIKTKQTIQFAHQHEIDGFPEIPTFLFAGYMLDETWTSIKNIYLLCKLGENLIWQIDLNGSVEQARLDIDYNATEVEIVIPSRVKVKIKEIKRSKTGS